MGDGLGSRLECDLIRSAFYSASTRADSNHSSGLSDSNREENSRNHSLILEISSALSKKDLYAEGGQARFLQSRIEGEYPAIFNRNSVK